MLSVTTMPKVIDVILARIRSERKATKKKKVKARMPAPTGGDSSSGIRRLKLPSLDVGGQPKVEDCACGKEGGQVGLLGGNAVDIGDPSFAIARFELHA